MERDDRLAEQKLAIARELHDGIAQELSALGYLLDSVIGRSTIDTKSREELRNARAEIGALTLRVRDEIFGLRTESSLSPTQRLLSQLEHIFATSEVEYSVTGSLPAENSLEIERALLELARNTRTHASASHFSIALTESQISVSDDGNGDLNLESARFGLRGSLERMRKLDFEVSYDNATRTFIFFRDKNNK